MLQCKEIKTFNRRKSNYLCDETGKKIVNVAFDELSISPNHNVYYQIGGKCDIVPESYFLAHPKRAEIIKNCKYSNFFHHKDFRVLVQDVASGAGLKIVEKEGKITTIDQGVVVGSGSRYIVYRVYGTYSYQAIYSSAEGVKYYTIEDLETNSKYVFDLEEFFNQFTDQVKSKHDLTELINFYRCVLLEDIKEFDKNTQKYVIIKNSPRIVQLMHQKPFIEYRIDNINTCFATPEDAKENATKIIKTLRKTILDRLNQEEDLKQNLIHDDEVQKGLLQKACEAFKKSTSFK